jgi:hypothetical protein
MLMSNCPKCNQRLIQTNVSLECENCETRFLICKSCTAINQFDDIEWQTETNYPRHYKSCTNCNGVLYETTHVYKSDIYNYFNYAFKFVNRLVVPYPMYFHEGFPFGDIEQDIGNYYNDFLYADNADFINIMMRTDWGTARAYRVKIKSENGLDNCIALSHETGLEVFLIAAGALIGVETSKFVLKRTLETIEKSINQWWGKRKSEHWQKDESDEPLVIGIHIRTPNWEINIDGKFTQEEKDKLFNLIQESVKPDSNIDKFLSPLNNQELSKKIKSSTRKITKRKN